MQFTKVLFAAATFVVAQAAKIGNTPGDFVGVTAGSTFNINWINATGSVTLLLKTGEANLLTTVSTIASGLTGSSYAWSIPSTLPVAYYAFEIDDSTGVPNYSVRFQITGGPSSTSSVASSTSTSASSSASTVTSTSSSASTTSAATGNSTSSTASSTSSTKTSTTSATKTSATSTSTSTTASVNSAAGIASPLAFVLLALVALMTLN